MRDRGGGIIITCRTQESCDFRNSMVFQCSMSVCVFFETFILTLLCCCFYFSVKVCLVQTDLVDYREIVGLCGTPLIPNWLMTVSELVKLSVDRFLTC